MPPLSIGPARSPRARSATSAAKASAPGSAGGDLLPPRGERARRREERVDAAHLGVDGDRLLPARRRVEERSPSAQGAGEPDRLDARRGDERHARLVRGAVDERERPRGEPGALDGGRHRLAAQRRRDGVPRVRLDDDGAAGGERRGGVAAGDAERHREVARREHADGADRHHRAAQVGLPLARGVDRRLEVPAGLDQVGERPQLARGAAALTGQARGSERRLGVGRLEQRVAEVLELLGRRAQQHGDLLAGRPAQRPERLGGRRDGGGDVGRRRLRDLLLARLARAGVDRAQHDATSTVRATLTSVPARSTLIRQTSPSCSV
jgi:hypothetical protein